MISIFSAVFFVTFLFFFPPFLLAFTMRRIAFVLFFSSIFFFSLNLFLLFLLKICPRYLKKKKNFLVRHGPLNVHTLERKKKACSPPYGGDTKAINNYDGADDKATCNGKRKGRERRREGVDLIKVVHAPIPLLLVYMEILFPQIALPS